jgi:hypothetical protein
VVHGSQTGAVADLRTAQQQALRAYPAQSIGSADAEASDPLKPEFVMTKINWIAAAALVMVLSAITILAPFLLAALSAAAL